MFDVVIDTQRDSKKCISCSNILILEINWTYGRQKKSIYICTPCDHEYSRRRKISLKAQILDHYGHECACCQEERRDCLCLDHINGDGAEQRRLTKQGGGHQFYSWVIRNRFPDDLRILCSNCNGSLGTNGYCPHNGQRIIIASNPSFLGTKGICRCCGEPLTVDNQLAYHREKEKHNLCKKCHNGLHSQVILHNKIKVINAYGGKCKSCGESAIEFLVIDHIKNGGNEHRRELGGTSYLYRWLIQNNFPQDDFQALCYNCNIIKEIERRRGNYNDLL